jgi:uncharacterized membrane protein
MDTTANIVIRIEGSSMAEVQRAIFALAAELGGGNIESVTSDADAPKADVKVKTRSKAVKAAKEVVDEPVQDEPKTEAPAPEGVVTDMTPAQARTEAIRLVTDFYASTPNAMPQITKVQTKYGVTKFGDVPDEKAHSLLADVRLLAAGALAD